VAGPERVHRSRHALPAPDAGPGPASRSCASAYGSDRPAHSADVWSPVRTTAASSTRTGSSGCGSRPSRRASSRTREPLRPTVPATRKIRSTMRCLPRGAVASRPARRQQAVEYLQRPLTGGRPQGRALAGPVVRPEATAMTIPTCSSAASRTTSSASWAAGPQRAPVRLSQRATEPPRDGPARRRRPSAPQGPDRRPQRSR
jgi:hypothetical protein